MYKKNIINLSSVYLNKVVYKIVKINSKSTLDH